MRMQAAYCRYILDFYAPAVTSRDVMNSKETYFIKVWHEDAPEIYGIGECAVFRGLSSDDCPEYENILSRCCKNINNLDADILAGFSSIKFGIETAVADLKNGGQRIVFPSQWSLGDSETQINGLVWMGNFEEMYSRINSKLDAGFKCVKMKIGGIDFDKELELIKYIRSHFPPQTLELRLDANGAFTADDAYSKLVRLSEYSIHSIEQPVKPKQWNLMAALCSCSPIPIALDEELIGLNQIGEKSRMLDAVRPQYIILKPALCGGFSGADEWISLAQERGIGWWATSALESNIGLNAIAQWVASYSPMLPQGLGTGMLYSNNIVAPLVQERDVLRYDTEKRWEIPTLDWVEP